LKRLIQQEEHTSEAWSSTKEQPLREMTFGDLATRYRNEAWPVKAHVRQSYGSNMRYLEKKWNNFTVVAMARNPAKIEAWLNTLTSYRVCTKPLSRQTLTHIRMLLHHIFERAMQWGLLNCAANPVSKIQVLNGKRPKPRELLLSAADFNYLITDPGLPEYITVMSTIAMMTGGPISRVLGMRWDDSVDFARRMIHFRRSVVGKNIYALSDNNPENNVAIPEYLSKVLQHWKASQTIVNGWVFGSRITGRPLHAMTLQCDYLKPAGERFGLSNLGWYTFRYSFRKYLNKLETVEAVQETLVSELSAIQRADKQRNICASSMLSGRTETLRNSDDSS